MRWSQLAPGLSHVDCGLAGQAFARHAHDTYTVVLTTGGVQQFWYRGGLHRSGPGHLVILHPGEVHDGMPGCAGSGFSYVGVHLSPVNVQQGLNSWRDTRGVALPFVPSPVLRDTSLARTLAWLDASCPLEPLARQDLVCALAAALQRAAGRPPAEEPGTLVADGRLRAAADFLRANAGRVVQLREVEAVAGLSMSELSRRFRRCYGTTPYRFHLARRVDAARCAIDGGAGLADAAVQSGFADQAHMSRTFRVFLGLTPARYRALSRAVNGSEPHSGRGGRAG